MNEENKKPDGQSKEKVSDCCGADYQVSKSTLKGTRLFCHRCGNECTPVEPTKGKISGVYDPDDMCNCGHELMWHIHKDLLPNLLYPCVGRDLACKCLSFELSKGEELTLEQKVVKFITDESVSDAVYKGKNCCDKCRGYNAQIVVCLNAVCSCHVVLANNVVSEAEDWELVFKKWYLEPYPAGWKAHMVIEKIRALLSEHGEKRYLEGEAVYRKQYLDLHGTVSHEIAIARTATIEECIAAVEEIPSYFSTKVFKATAIDDIAALKSHPLQSKEH